MNTVIKTYRSHQLLGTVVCSVITQKKIYLFSDGRVHKDGNIVADDHSKVHKATNFTGILTAGMYLEPLVPTIVDECKAQELYYVEEVVQVTALVLKKIWDDNLSLMEKREKEEEMKIAAFVAGFSRNIEPRLYYLESNSNPRFAILQRPLFKSGNDVEIGALVSAETKHDATTLMIKHVQRILKKSNNRNLYEVFRSAFDSTKEEISSDNRLVGGYTFVGIIDPTFGFKCEYP